MSTQEDRIAALERKVAAIENTPSMQAFNLRELNENMTILLGVSSSQGGDIKAIKENVSSINDRLEGVEQRLDRLETKSDEQTTLLTQILARLPEKPWQ
jgi:Tfp pilus assembly protein PilN